MPTRIGLNAQDQKSWTSSGCRKNFPSCGQFREKQSHPLNVIKVVLSSHLGSKSLTWPTCGMTLEWASRHGRQLVQIALFPVLMFQLTLFTTDWLSRMILICA